MTEHRLGADGLWVVSVSQKSVVLAMLKEAGARGVEVHELVYRRGITRAAAIIHDLREIEGLDIVTAPSEDLPDGRKRLARYILRGYEKPKRVPPPERGFFDEDPPPAKEIRWDCGCVRAADGRSWAHRCERHASRPQKHEETVSW